jgi:hypothetical protein
MSTEGQLSCMELAHKTLCAVPCNSLKFLTEHRQKSVAHNHLSLLKNRTHGGKTACDANLP